MEIRRVRPEDGFKIIELYHEVYGGDYPDANMRDYLVFKKTCMQPEVHWFIGEENNEIVASLVFRYDQEHLLVKAHGAASHPRMQGKGVMAKIMAYGLEALKRETPGVEVIYATTRSVHEGAQALLDQFGFRKIGIFPNTHKSAGDYETHSLAAWFSPEAFDKRFTEYLIHEQLVSLYDLVRAEIPEMLAPTQALTPEPSSRVLNPPPRLEIVAAPAFAQHRFSQLQEQGTLEFQFLPFHAPNLMVLSADQTVEIFLNFNPDGHCVLIGAKVSEDINYSDLISRVSIILRDYGARYIEMILRADKPKVIDSVLRAKMIPSAIFPAFQLKDGKRWDFIVFSRSFEVFDFQNVKLKGLNQRYLEAYFTAWKRISLNPKMLDV